MPVSIWRRIASIIYDALLVLAILIVMSIPFLALMLKKITS